MKKRKSWREKLADAKDLPKVMAIPLGMQPKWGGGAIVIPAPVEVDQIMRKVPKGKLITINDLRETLARKHGATIGCPITTGIFARIAAGAAEEDRRGREGADHSLLAHFEIGGRTQPQISRRDRRAESEAESRRAYGGLQG